MVNNEIIKEYSIRIETIGDDEFGEVVDPVTGIVHRKTSDGRLELLYGFETKKPMAEKLVPL